MLASIDRARGARVTTMLTVVACAALLHAAPLHAETGPRAASMRIGATLDADAFARTVAARYRIELRHVVAADIDRDGDLDVLGSTDRELLVWVNDGAGRLTSHPLAGHKPQLSADSPGHTWGQDDGSDRGTIQDDAPSPRAVITRWQAPPLDVSRASLSLAIARPSNVLVSLLAARAPPLLA